MNEGVDYVREHHVRTISRLTERFKDDPNFLAMVVGGSIAKGYDKENSDVDIMLIATEMLNGPGETEGCP